MSAEHNLLRADQTHKCVLCGYALIGTRSTCCPECANNGRTYDMRHSRIAGATHRPYAGQWTLMYSCVFLVIYFTCGIVNLSTVASIAISCIGVSYVAFGVFGWWLWILFPAILAALFAFGFSILGVLWFSDPILGVTLAGCIVVPLIVAYCVGIIARHVVVLVFFPDPYSKLRMLTRSSAHVHASVDAPNPTEGTLRPSDVDFSAHPSLPMHITLSESSTPPGGADGGERPPSEPR